jgi:hypothetical protein
VTAARDWVHARLVEHLPDTYQVERWAPQLDTVQAPTLLLRLDGIEPAPEAGQHQRRYLATVLAVSPRDDATADATDEVDAVAEDVLYAIDQSDQVTWTACKRVSVDDLWAGWEVAIRTIPLTLTP